jgi:methionyl-tRNA synthetase
MRYLITSALPYINGIKHLGNLTGSMLPADVHARFRRMQGHEVLFICATDEHGTPAELAAEEAAQSVKDYCNAQHQIQNNIYRSFDLSFDWFGRTSSKENRKLTQHFSRKLEENGLIEQKTSKQIYSLDDRRFLPDRYVEGTCPHCKFSSARGDQCDACGILLDPMELLNPRSKISGSTKLETRETAHLFLQQQKMEAQIRKWILTRKWPHLATSIANKWLNEGLQERSITRDLRWGVPVVDKDGNPRAGFDEKVYYVWFDAPIGYIGATQEWANNTGQKWERWWRTDQGASDIEYVQFMGKDNVAFHTVSFPVTILGSQEPWKLVDRLKAFNWVNWYGNKFSTSQKRGVFMDSALSLLPSDYWRWYLMANAPENGDFAFTWESFQATCNADLANNLGNFVNRITRFCATRFDGKVPSGGSPGPAELKLFNDIDEKLQNLTTFHEQIEIKKSTSETRAIWIIGNEYLTGAAPWTTIKTDPERAAVAVRTGLNLCVLYAKLAQPFIPNTAEKILKAFNIKISQTSWPNGKAVDFLTSLVEGSPVGQPPVLFDRIEGNWIQQQSERFGGADVRNGNSQQDSQRKKKLNTTSP